MNYFPIKIIYTKSNEIVVIKSPDQLRNGESFKVLETSVKEEQE